MTFEVPEPISALNSFPAGSGFGSPKKDDFNYPYQEPVEEDDFLAKADVQVDDRPPR